METPLKKQHLLRSASGLSQPTFYRLTPVRIWDGVLKIFGLACTLEASWPCKPAEMGSTPTGSTKTDNAFCSAVEQAVLKPLVAGLKPVCAYRKLIVRIEMSKVSFIFLGPLAQLVEHLSGRQKVMDSISICVH